MTSQKLGKETVTVFKEDRVKGRLLQLVNVFIYLLIYLRWTTHRNRENRVIARREGILEDA